MKLKPEQQVSNKTDGKGLQRWQECNQDCSWICECFLKNMCGWLLQKNVYPERHTDSCIESIEQISNNGWASFINFMKSVSKNGSRAVVVTLCLTYSAENPECESGYL